jgi:D-alanyl-D-alanine carboxypeptidase/D-alanyl-D-alanine-endopeptidase (penicillin-binding protein 4)
MYELSWITVGSRSSCSRLICLLIVLFLFASCSITESPPKPGPIRERVTTDIPEPGIDLTKPLIISKKPRDAALCEKINRTIANSKFANARWGIIAIGLNDGRVVCGREARKVFNPASIQKLLTSIVSTDKLGGDFTWKTSAFVKNGIKDGIIDGDLILYGRGAPDLDDAGLKQLVKQLKQKGLRKVTGNIIGDESYFKGDNLGDGWTWNELQWYYGAAASALSINRNQVTISLNNGSPKTDRKFVELTGEVKPIESIEAIGVKRELGTNRVFVWGNGKNLSARIAISKPALLSARILKEILEINGIPVSGVAKSVDWKSRDRLDTETATELVFVRSATLSEIIQKMNRDSVNLYAELILRTLGKKFGAEAPDDNPKMQILRGDDSAGASVVEKWLHDQNIATNGVAVHDGSGLSRLDLVTPEAIGRALVYAAQSKFARSFENSLPVAGQTGTLRGRFKNVSGKILAKTGSITYVTSLAGFAKSNNEIFAFAIIVNNETHKEESSETIDQIASVLVEE